MDDDTPLAPLIFGVTLHDGAGNEWKDQFQVDVTSTGADLGVDHIELLEDENGDGKVSPGEWAKVAVYVANTGSSKSLSVWGKVSEPGNWVDITGNYGNVQYSSLPELAPGQVVNLVQVKFSLDDDTPLAPLIFGVTFHDGAGNEWKDQFQVQVVQ